MGAPRFRKSHRRRHGTCNCHLKGFMSEIGCPGFALPLASSFATYSPCCLATCIIMHQPIAATGS